MSAIPFTSGRIPWFREILWAAHDSSNTHEILSTVALLRFLQLIPDNFPLG